MTKTILVAGATGRQGGAVVRHLLKNNLAVKALSRTPDSIAAERLASLGIMVVKGDMADTATLIHAMRDCDGVFSTQNYFEYGGEKEIQYGKNLADAAKQAGISTFLYSSVCNADNSGVPHFDTKYAIEEYIKAIGLPATILRPVKFMENYYIPQVFRGILDGKLFDAIKPGKKHQMIAVDDVGKYAAQIFLNPDKYINKTFELAGDELSNEEVADTMTNVMGKKIKFKRLPLFVAKLVVDKEIYRMFKWFNEKGFTAKREEVNDYFPSVKTWTLREFLLNENWQRWNVKGNV